MEAGRELDALVAEKVMEQNPHWLGDGVEVNILSIGESGVEVPHYSTEIAAAWAVMEKLGDYWACTIAGCGKPGVLRACFRAGDTSHTVEAETAPHAICLAALKAMG